MKSKLQSEAVPRGTRTIWRYLSALFLLFTFAIGNVMAEDFTITPITGSYLSPGNLVKITYSGDLKISSTQIQTTNKNKSGVITLTTIAPGVYLKSASFTDANWSTATKRATLECTSGGSIVGVDGVYTFTASANATTATISITAGTSGAAKLGSVSLVVTNGTTNDIETYSTFAKTDDNFSFTAKCNGTSITPAAALSSSTWTVSSNNISAPSSSDSKTITVSSANNIKFIAFYDSNCRLSIVEKSSSGGTCDGASWSVGSSPTKSVTFKNGIGTSLAITKVFVITEAASKHHVTYGLNGATGTTPTQADVAEGAKFTLHNGTTGITAPANKAFAGWNDGTTTYAGGAEYTMGTSDVTLTAQWSDSYSVTYVLNGPSGDAPTEANKAGGAKFSLAAAPTYAGYRFMGWNDGTNTYAAEAEYTMPSDNVTLTAQWSALYAIATGTPDNGTVAAGVDEAIAGEEVTVTATPATNYMLSAWDVYKTGESSTKVSVANGKFTMPAYAVTVNATFVADTRKKVLYVTSTAEATVKENDKLYDALKDIYNVSIVGPTSDANQTNYDLVVLHESIGGGNYGATAVAAAKSGSTPVLNTKSYFYNDGRWGWGAPNAGQSVKGATLNSSYCNIADHPLFDGVTMTAGFFEITDDAAAKCMQPVGSFTSGKEGYTLATTPNSGEGNGCAIHELTPAQRGASAGKYLMISVSNDKLNALNANGQKLFQNAAAYLTGSTAWAPEAPKTVTHTLTGVTTVSAEEVCAGVAYEATYVAESGYSLPDAIVVKVNGVALDAVDYTWSPSTGALFIPAAFVGGNIEIVVNGVFNCPAAGSGDVVFSWTPKSGSVSTEYIAAGGVDLAPYMESVVGGSITGYAQNIDETTTTLYKNNNNHIYFNGNDAYIQVDLCELAEGDKFLVSGQANNLWVSTSATRPADAASAAAVLVPDEAFYIPNASALIGLSTIYIFREADFTEVASLTITRPEKFTVTYAASDLTAGDVPAAVDAFNGQKIIVAGQGTMVKGVDNFAGWKDAGDNAYAAGDELIVTSNLTLTAQWVSCTPLTLAMSGYNTTLTAGGATTTVTLDKGASTGTVTWESSDPTILTVADGVVTPLKGGAATVTAHVAEDGTYCANDITSDEITVNCVVAYDANGGEGTMADGVGTTVTIAANSFTYDSHKFLRWNTQPDGLGDDVAVGATVNENKTLYAIWKEVNCAPGTIFSLEMKTGLSNEGIAAGGYKEMTSDYATVTGGSATLRNDGADNTKARIYNSNIYLGGAAGYVVVELDCPLQVNDVIAFTGDNSNKICFTLTSTRATTYATTDGEFTVTSAFLNGNDNVTTIYVWRESGNGTTIHSLTVTRPAPDAPVPTIDAATPADASYAATDPIAAMTVSADAVAPKDLHYQWYKEAGETDIEVGTDAASYTPTASGEYYCVVTNSPTGYTPKSATSRTATITMISSDATLAWIKAGDVNIALSAGVFEYEYTLPYNYAEADAPTVTVGTTDPNANAEITQAVTKTGTATIHVVAQDNVTEKDYSVKFKEFSGCMDAFYFAEVDDAEANSLVNDAVFFSDMQSDGSDLAQTFTIDAVDYTVTRSTSSKGSFGKLTIPAGFSANVYVGLRTTGERTVTLEPESGTKYDVVVPQSDNAVAEFTDVAAGVYTIKVSSNCNFAVVKAHICKFAVTDVSLPATESVLVGKTVTLTPVFTPTYASNKNVTWASDAEGVATVANGVVTGVSAGTANITVTTVDGGFQSTCAVTVSAMDCNTFIGNLFSFAVVATENKQYEEVGEGSNEKEIGAEVATVESGAAYVGHTSSSATIDVANKQSGVWYFKFGDSNTYLRIELSCALQTGDIISLTSLSQNFYISTTAAYPSDAANRIEIPANGEYVVLHGDILDGADEIYVWRKSGSTYLKTLSIDRNTPDYKRTVNPAYLGTLCWTNNAILGGATLFELAGKNESNYLVFDEVTENRLEAGKPYIFLPDNGKTEIKVYNTDDAAPLTVDQDPVNHMYGTITGKILVPGVDDNMYYFSSSHIWAVKDFSVNIEVPAYYCYVDYVAVLAGAPASAPAAGRRRVTMGVNGKDAAQGFENILGGDKPLKVMIDGTLYIIRGEKVFDATGRLVK